MRVLGGFPRATQSRISNDTRGLGRDEAVVEQRPRLSRSNLLPLRSSEHVDRCDRRIVRSTPPQVRESAATLLTAAECPPGRCRQIRRTQTNVLRAEDHFFFSQFLHEYYDYKCIGHIKHM